MASDSTPLSPVPDLSQCEAEPIHVPGSIQPHGVLLAMQGPALRISQVSLSCQALLGSAAAELLGHELAKVLGSVLADAVHLALVRYRDRPLAPIPLDWQPATGECAFAGYVHQSDATTVLDLEPVPAASPTPGHALVQTVREFDAVYAQTDLPAQLQTAAILFQQLTGYDRVMIYRFDDDWHGEVIAEARRPELEPFLGLHFPPSDIPAQARRLYLISPTRVIVDRDYAPSPLLPALNPETGQPLDLSLSQLRSVSPVHLEYLRNMGVQATLTASLLLNGRLWGLIACHHGTPRQVSPEIREIAGWMARDLSNQIALLEEQRRQRAIARLKQCRDRIINAMRQGTRLSALLTGPQLPDVLGAIGADGVALIHGEDLAAGGVTPERSRIRGLVARLSARHADGAPQLFATDCLSAHVEGTQELAATAAGVAMFPLAAAQSIKLIWFRDEQLRHITWGGNPDKAVDRAPDGRLSPRRSFAAWSELVSGHSRRWSREELESARELGALIDIEWRRVAEEAKLAQEVLLKDVLDSLTAHIAVLDRRGVITLVNANWLRFAERNGGGLACLPGVNYLTVCNRVVGGQDGLEAQAALRGIQQVLAGTKGAFTLTYPCDSPTEPRWFEMRVLPLSGPQRGAVIAHEEITARMLTQQALQASEQRLQRVLEGANDGFWDWNITTGDLVLSPRWAQMLGYDQSEIEPHARGWEKLVHPDDLPRVWAEVQAHCCGATARYQSEHRMLTKQGDWCWIQARAKITVRDAAGQPLWMAGTNTDITERRHAEEALRISLAAVQRHDAQMVVLNQMNDLLLACRSREEAYAIIDHSAAVLFAPWTGALAVVDEVGTDLQRVAAWGIVDGLPPTFPMHDCWALRRGQPHAIEPGQADIDCLHFLDRPPPTYLCIPLNVRGVTLGLLHVSGDAALTAAALRELRILAVAVGESIKLALSNIKSQEALRVWQRRQP